MQFLFNKMDTNQDRIVDWDEFCTYMMVGLQEKDDMRNERENPVMVCPVLFETAHRTAIIKILSVPSPPRFLTISEDGFCTYWSNKLKVVNRISLDRETFGHAKSLRVTDACYLPNAFRICLATTARDIRFYKADDGLPYQRVDLPDIALSLNYYMSSDQPERGTLLVGDMAGWVTVFKFTECTTHLFNDSPAGLWTPGEQPRFNLSTVAAKPKGSNLPSRVTFSRHQVHFEEGQNMLNQSVGKVMYVSKPDFDGFLSCATTTNNAMVFYDLEKGLSRQFKIYKGCFDFDVLSDRDDGHHMIASGGNDTRLRLWNPYVPNHPVAVMSGHRSAIVHVLFNPSAFQVLTISDSEIIKIWDVKQRVCLNTLGNIIPHKLMQKTHRSTRVFWHEQAQSLLCSTYTEFACIMLSRDNVQATHTSHDHAISALAFIPEYKLVATGCYGGDINLWDLCSGAKTLEYDKAHTGSAVTSLSVAVGGRRLVSGSSSGEIFVWNTLSGVVLMKLLKVEAREVVGVLTTKDRIYSAGWDGRIVSFVHHEEINIAEAPIDVRQDTRWAPSVAHSDDILAMDNCGETLLATGSFDGDIIVWNLKLARSLKKFDSRSFRKKLNTSKSKADGTTDAHLPKIASTARAAVDELLWLKARVKLITENSQRGGTLAMASMGTLVSSSDGGCICLWNALKGDLLGAFYAVDDKFGSEAVYGLDCDDQNEYLYTGDSVGYVRVYMIANYGTDGIATKPPRLSLSWRAHVQAISSLRYVQKADVVITGSRDQSVRVWNAQTGDFVGTFGGSSMWSLKIHEKATFRGAARRLRFRHGKAGENFKSAFKLSHGITDHVVPPGAKDDGVHGSTHAMLLKSGGGDDDEECDQLLPRGLPKGRRHSLAPPDVAKEMGYDDDDGAGGAAAALPPMRGALAPGGATGWRGDASEGLDADEAVDAGAADPGSLPNIAKVKSEGAGADADTLAFPAIAEDAGGSDDVVGDGGEASDGSASAVAETLQKKKPSLAVPTAGKAKARRATELASESYMAQFKLPSIKKEDEGEGGWQLPVPTSATEMNLDWDRRSVLGKAYTKKAHKWHTEKQAWRERTPRPDMTKTNMDGLLVCVPYNTLRLGMMESIKSRGIPSAVATSRRRLDRIAPGRMVGDGSQKRQGRRAGRPATEGGGGSDLALPPVRRGPKTTDPL